MTKTTTNNNKRSFNETNDENQLHSNKQTIDCAEYKKQHNQHQIKRRRIMLNEKTNLNQSSRQLSLEDSNSQSNQSNPASLDLPNEKNEQQLVNDSNVVVPSWRVLNLKAMYKLEKTEVKIKKKFIY